MKFWRRIREGKLYKQWTKYAELPPEALHQIKTPKDVTTKGEEKDRGYLFRVKIVNLVKRILRVE